MKNILVAIDFSRATFPILKAAESLAHAEKARVVLLGIGRPPEVGKAKPSATDFALVDQNDVGRKLAQHGAQLAAGGLEVEPFERYGPPADCILEEARRIHADYIVMGSHGHGGLYETFVGSTTGGVLKHAPCPVVVVAIARA